MYNIRVQDVSGRKREMGHSCETSPMQRSPVTRKTLTQK